MRAYKKLELLEKYHDMSLFSWKYSLPDFSKPEHFDLSSQSKRVAYPVQLNIGEASGRFKEKDFTAVSGNLLGSDYALAYGSLLSRDIACWDQVHCRQI